MKVLYGYRYGIVGGVSTQLLLRRAALRDVGIRCEIFFSQDNGLGQILTDNDGIHFGTDKSFGQLVRSGRFDAVIVIDSPELLGAATGFFYHRNSVFLDVHTTVATGLAYLADISPSRLAGVLVPTRYSTGLVSKRLPVETKINILPNILDTRSFAPAASFKSGEREFRQTEPREFVWVGKLDHHKNWRLALVYAAMLRQVLGDIHLHIVGGYTAPSSQGEAFFSLAHRLGISDCVSWVDRVENAALVRLYQQCAASGGAMLVTSRDESFGMAAAEALLCGCPLIANDLPVFREVLPTSPLVHLVDIWKPEQVAKAARTLTALPRPDDVAALHDKLSERYGAAAFVRSFMPLLDVRP